MAAQYQVGDRVSSTEYNPSYFSRKTKELFTPGQGPARCTPGPQTLLLERLDPTQPPGKAVSREGEPARGWTGLGMAAPAVPGWLHPAGKAVVVPAHGVLTAGRAGLTPSPVTLLWTGALLLHPALGGGQSPHSTPSSLPEDGGAGLWNTIGSRAGAMRNESGNEP